MKKYDGLGFRMPREPLKIDPKYNVLSPTPGKWAVSCEDVRTLATFLLEPIDLADGGFFIAQYKRQMSMLEKIKAEPGLTVDDILKRYNDFERNTVYPKLGHDLVRFMLDELATVGYIELREGRAYPKKRLHE
jgi:hypothetical protein